MHKESNQFEAHLRHIYGLFTLWKKDAAKSADIERGKLVEQQRQLELRKRELLEKESKFQTQQSELELRINEAKDQKVHSSHKIFSL